MLWIAFKNYYLRDEEQLGNAKVNDILSCELLSKIIIFETKNNVSHWRMNSPFVVNCFQKLLSSRRRTTIKLRVKSSKQLWIAFKNYYLRDEEQLREFIFGKAARCELLSKIIIFETKNNSLEMSAQELHVVNCFQKLLSSRRRTTPARPSWILTPVVNCFQKLLSSRRRTTLILKINGLTMLWIAFKNYYLRDEEQHQNFVVQ